MSQENFKYFAFEIPILEALSELGGKAEIDKIYDWIRKNKSNIFNEYPEILGRYKEGEGDVIWKNKIRWAREYMKHKGQLEFPERGVWRMTSAGTERLRLWKNNGKDPDAGLESVIQVPEEKGGEPERAFEILSHNHGNILGVKIIPIVYEPINEQGVILLFTALAERLSFLIVAIRPQFPDAQLARKNEDGIYKDVRVEFEFKSSNFKLHGHDYKRCDLIICWEHDWKKSPIEVLELKSEVDKLRNN